MLSQRRQASGAEANQNPADNREVELADNLLKQLYSDQQILRQTEQTSETVTNLSESLPAISQAEFNKILAVARRIHEDDELKAVREEQARHNKSGEKQAAALIAENDVVLPAAQARILEVNQIPLNTFELARARTKIAEDQINSRLALASSLGLPVNASRERIEAEQNIEKACNKTLEEIQTVMNELERASKTGQFRHDLIDREGNLSRTVGYSGEHLYVSLLINTDPFSHSVEYPGFTTPLEYLRDILSNFYKGKSYGANKLASYDIDFSDAFEILKTESPAFSRFLERLPQGIEVRGNIRTELKDSKNNLLQGYDQNGKIKLMSVDMYFKLEGYCEDPMA
jgi:hypothetical protein